MNSSGKMKRTNRFVFLIACILILVFTICICVLKVADRAEASGNWHSGNVVVRTTMDPDTGIYYLIFTDDWGRGFAVTPRLNVDGLPLCSEDANHQSLEEALYAVRKNIENGEIDER